MPTLFENEARVLDDRTKLTLVMFLHTVAKARNSALFLDFDGTLAPFRVDPSKVQPWAGVLDALQKIQDTGRTRLAIISGRAAREVALQLPLRNPLEIWGMHGAERLHSDGRIERDDLRIEQRHTLTVAGNLLYTAQWKHGVRIEEKWNAVAVHWRGAAVRSAYAAYLRSQALLRPFAQTSGMELLQFDGGVELRAGRNKGGAVRQLLSELPTDSPVAYLGDDSTDEDAFSAIAGRGLGVLVRRRWRPSAAVVRLYPHSEVLNFLSSWACAVQ